MGSLPVWRAASSVWGEDFPGAGSSQALLLELTMGPGSCGPCVSTAYAGPEALLRSPHGLVTWAQ